MGDFDCCSDRSTTSPAHHEATKAAMQEAVEKALFELPAFEADLITAAVHIGFDAGRRDALNEVRDALAQLVERVPVQENDRP